MEMAREIIKQIERDYWAEKADPIDMAEIFDLAIKALEQEPFLNKLCVSSGVCEHDKNKVLDKIKAEILENAFSVVNPNNTYEYINVLDLGSIEKIIDKYKAETEAE